MIKYILIFLTINLNAQQWLESDKQLHLIGGAGFGALGYTVGYEVSKGKRSTAIWYGIGSATAVGTFKELWDIPSTGFDRDDKNVNNYEIFIFIIALFCPRSII